MRNWIKIVEIAESVPAEMPAWWTQGAVINLESPEAETLDIHEFLEGDEFDYEWRLCRVPMTMIKNIASMSLPVPAEEHAERLNSIRDWYNQDGIDAALSTTPPILLFHDGKIKRILDGYHRIKVAQERSAPYVIAAVGYGPGEN